MAHIRIEFRDPGAPLSAGREVVVDLTDGGATPAALQELATATVTRVLAAAARPIEAGRELDAKERAT